MFQISRFRNPIVALTLTAFLACAATAGEPTPHDRTDPRFAFDAFITAFNALDWESFRACFSDDASLFNPDIPGAISDMGANGTDAPVEGVVRSRRGEVHRRSDASVATLISLTRVGAGQYEYSSLYMAAVCGRST